MDACLESRSICRNADREDNVSITGTAVACNPDAFSGLLRSSTLATSAVYPGTDFRSNVGTANSHNRLQYTLYKSPAISGRPGVLETRSKTSIVGCVS